MRLKFPPDRDGVQGDVRPSSASAQPHAIQGGDDDGHGVRPDEEEQHSIVHDDELCDGSIAREKDAEDDDPEQEEGHDKHGKEPSKVRQGARED